MIAIDAVEGRCRVLMMLVLRFVPTLRGLDDATLRSRLVQDAGMRFRRVAWIAVVLLLVVLLGLMLRA